MFLQDEVTLTCRPRNPTLASLCLALVMSVAGGAQVDNVPSATERHGGFALQDQTGGRPLLIPNLAAPEGLKAALCTGGRRFPVRFARRQVERTDGA